MTQRKYDGDNWRDNPDEWTDPAFCDGGFLASRGYPNPEIAALKFKLAEDIQQAVARRGNRTQAAIAAGVRAAGVPLSQPDVSAILNGNVKAFTLDRLLEVATALGVNITMSSEAGAGGAGHVLVRQRRRPRREGTQVATARAGAVS